MVFDQWKIPNTWHTGIYWFFSRIKMTPRKRTSPEVQQVLGNEETGPMDLLKDWIGKRTIWRIKKRGEIQHSNEYKSTPGTNKGLALNLDVSKQTLSRVFRK
jgi:hypothetical protein